MARRGHAYPQVEPGAAGMATLAVVSLPREAGAAAALAVARRRGARVLALGARGPWVLREDAARAVALGLGHVAARALARPLPLVAASASEVAVRRHLASGAPVVLVAGPHGTVGAVAAPVRRGEGTRPSLGARIAARVAAPTREALAAVAAAAAAQPARAFAVGGLVRDLLRDAELPARDLDVVVEGDARALAREIAGRLGGTVLEHERFLTAAVEGGPAGRVDVATSRCERYDVPGALPRVMPAGIVQDLGRRDFTVNAMAIELAPAPYALLDPFAGRADLLRRRLRVLHPLSFVEDPTRIFRAARYAARLGFTEDAWTIRARSLALRLVPYAALSGQRIVTELERILTDARPAVALARLGAAGVFRLLDPRYRFTATTRARVAALPDVLGWRTVRGVDARDVDVAVLALVADQAPDVAESAVRRLGLSGEPLVRLLRARQKGAPLTDRVRASARPSDTARLLRDCSPLELVWLALLGDAAVRERVDWFVAGGHAVQSELRGDDLIALGVPRGPAVARVLAELRDARLDERVGDRDMEVAHVRRWLSSGKEG